MVVVAVVSVLAVSTRAIGLAVMVTEGTLSIGDQVTGESKSGADAQVATLTVANITLVDRAPEGPEELAAGVRVQQLESGEHLAVIQFDGLYKNGIGPGWILHT
jgi:hypothetical protein